MKRDSSATTRVNARIGGRTIRPARYVALFDVGRSRHNRRAARTDRRWKGLEATPGIEPGYTVLQSVGGHFPKPLTLTRNFLSRPEIAIWCGFFR